MSVTRWPSPGRGLLTAGLLTLAGGAALFFATAPRAAEPPPQPPAPGQPPSPRQKLTAEEYRRKYPFESLAGRLAYEEGPARELKDGGAAPPLSADARNRLDAADAPRAALGQDMRRKTLEILHSDEAQKFIDRGVSDRGQGATRRGRAGVERPDRPAAEGWVRRHRAARRLVTNLLHAPGGVSVTMRDARGQRPDSRGPPGKELV